MTCSIPDCHNIAERSGKCATHARLERKAMEESLKPPKTKKPINKTSDKMAKALREYAKLRKEFLAANPMCAVYPSKPSEDVHHQIGRSTIERLLDTDNWLAVSREGHNYIHAHPNEAIEKGWSFPRLAKRDGIEMNHAVIDEGDYSIANEPHIL